MSNPKTKDFVESPKPPDHYEDQTDSFYYTYPKNREYVVIAGDYPLFRDIFSEGDPGHIRYWFWRGHEYIVAVHIYNKGTSLFLPSQLLSITEKEYFLTILKKGDEHKA